MGEGSYSVRMGERTPRSPGSLVGQGRRRERDKDRDAHHKRTRVILIIRVSGITTRGKKNPTNFIIVIIIFK